jgi:NAD(P) transhydrogenase
METQRFDLIVIGGGPAGAGGANAAGLMGKRVALVERLPRIGGAGINTGTIPSKTLRESALALSGWRTRRLFGVDLSLRHEATIGDFMHHEKQVTAEERARLETRLQRHCVELIYGEASFVDPHTVAVRGRDGAKTLYYGEKILIATGSRPVRPAEFPFEDDRVHDSDEILDLKELPKKLVVVGAGVIGSEYACMFAALGTEVIVVDGRNELLSFLDKEISAALLQAMTGNGIRFLWNERVTVCDVSRPGPISLTLASGAVLGCDGVLVCAGRSSNTESLQLPVAGITPGQRGLISVNEFYRTEQENIYAAGDVIGPPALAASSAEQARVAISHAFQLNIELTMAAILPTGIYTIPELSMAGETEEALKAKNIPYIAGRARYLDNPRGKIMGDESGFLKLLFHVDDWKLLGVHVIGEQATELVHIGLLGLTSGATADTLRRICFNYPTLGDLYKYAAFDAILQRLVPSCKIPSGENAME